MTWPFLAGVCVGLTVGIVGWGILIKTFGYSFNTEVFKSKCKKCGREGPWLKNLELAMKWEDSHQCTKK